MAGRTYGRTHVRTYMYGQPERYMTPADRDRGGIKIGNTGVNFYWNHKTIFFVPNQNTLVVVLKALFEISRRPHHVTIKIALS